MLEYIRRIAVFIVAESVMLGIVHNEDYKKFIKMCSGMIMIILVLSPLDRLFGITDTISGFLREITNEREYEEAREALASGIEGNLTDSGIEKVKGEYEKLLKEQIGQKAAEYGYELVGVEVSFDENQDNYIGMIRLTMTMEDKEESRGEIIIEKINIGDENIKAVEEPDIMAVKNYITDTYGIDYDRISVEVGL
ncbi:MAG: stage III sporulation protein AF [Lachnospiraceae bacterium]